MNKRENVSSEISTIMYSIDLVYGGELNNIQEEKHFDLICPEFKNYTSNIEQPEILRAVILFGKVASHYQKKGLDIFEKSNEENGYGAPEDNLVTAADISGGIALTKILKRFLGENGIIVNEEDEYLASVNDVNDALYNKVDKDYIAFIDPIDGTKLYTEGDDDWGTMLSIFKKDENGEFIPALSIAYSPNKSHLIYADTNNAFVLNKNSLDELKSNPLHSNQENWNKDTRVNLPEYNKTIDGENINYRNADGKIVSRYSGVSSLLSLHGNPVGDSAWVATNPSSAWDIACGILYSQHTGAFIHSNKERVTNLKELMKMVSPKSSDDPAKDWKIKTIGAVCLPKNIKKVYSYLPEKQINIIQSSIPSLDKFNI